MKQIAWWRTWWWNFRPCKSHALSDILTWKVSFGGWGDGSAGDSSAPIARGGGESRHPRSSWASYLGANTGKQQRPSFKQVDSKTQYPRLSSHLYTHAMACHHLPPPVSDTHTYTRTQREKERESPITKYFIFLIHLEKKDIKWPYQQTLQNMKTNYTETGPNGPDSTLSDMVLYKSFDLHILLFLSFETDLLVPAVWS